MIFLEILYDCGRFLSLIALSLSVVLIDVWAFLFELSVISQFKLEHVCVILHTGILALSC